MFLSTNDRIINLQNVSNINILKERNRIIFNLNYNIEIKDYGNDKSQKSISDYVYWDSYDEKNLISNINHLKESEYFKDNFIEQIDGNGYINFNEISSIKFSDKKNRVIFNLSHSVTFTDYDGNDRITSGFVYVNCKTKESYTTYKQYVKQLIPIKLHSSQETKIDNS